MIFKGLKDENGNVIPVQGAGTVYDEEKNSLALGKDTVAIGQDQLVFGRKNVADVNKAEIVGGGTSFTLGYVIVPANPEREEEAMIYAGHSLEEFRTFLNTFYGITPEDVVIADEYRYAMGSPIEIPNVADYDKLAFVVSEVAPSGDDGIYSLYIYGIDVNTGRIFKPFSEVQGHFYFKIEDGVKSFTNQGLDYFLSGAATLRAAVGNPTYGANYFNKNGNFYKTIMALRGKNIRTLDWEGNEELAGGLTAGGDVICGDGEGGTISMQDLLSRIAVLEAAAAQAESAEPAAES